jgi:hypothetical protein
VFEAHLTAATCWYFGIDSHHCRVPVPEENQADWLTSVARDIVEKIIHIKNPSYSNEGDNDHVYMYHGAVMHMGFLYSNLHEAIRYENGPQIIRLWKFWLLHFLGSKRKNYASEATNLLTNLAADWTLEIAHIHTLRNSQHDGQTRL